VITEFIGELHVPSIQCISCHLLDLHIQEGSWDEKQDIWRNTCTIQAWEWQVSGPRHWDHVPKLDSEYSTDCLHCVQDWLQWWQC